MEVPKTNVPPLSVYHWGAPHQLLVPPGSQIGKVADVRHFLGELNVNFDLIVNERKAPFTHPVHEAYHTHPVHTKAFNKRQFDVLRYGMVLNEAKGLVLIPAPHSVADSGDVINRQFQGIFNDSLQNTETAHHTLLPEYSFLVIQLPSNVGEPETVIPKVLFRLLFRNEAYTEEAVPFLCTKFPLFRLRAVFVSHKVYPTMQEVFQYRQGHPDVYTTESGKVIPNPRVEKVLNEGEVGELCNTWLTVLDSIAPPYVRDQGLGPDVVSLFLRTHRALDGKSVQDRQQDYSTPQVNNCVRISYLYNEPRMLKRIEVVKRERGMLNQWRDGAFNMTYFEEAYDDVEPGVATAPAARIVFKPTRDGVTDMIRSEICAYVPKEHEYKDQKVYRRPAAERLRLWILKGLMAAEINDAHVVLIDIDTALLLFQCVGLLWGEGEEYRHKEYVFHVCKVVVETVEDYVQHSGIIWKAYIVVSDEDNVKAARLCQEILEVVQKAKRRVELQEKDKADHAEEEAAEREHRRQLYEEHAKKRMAEKAAAANAKSKEDGASGSLVVYDERFGMPKKTSIPPDVVSSAERLGIHIDDEVLYPLFESLCPKDVPLAPVSKVVELLMMKLIPKDGDLRAFWPHSHPLLLMDCCGTPCDEKRVWNFVMGFSLKTNNNINTAAVIGNQDAPDTYNLNYIQFSMMMLAFAKV